MSFTEMHPQDTDWRVLDLKNWVYLLWRWHNKAVYSEKSQLVKVLALPLFDSLMVSGAHGTGSFSSSPRVRTAPSAEAVCLPGVISSSALKETGLPEVSPVPCPCGQPLPFPCLEHCVASLPSSSGGSQWASQSSLEDPDWPVLLLWFPYEFSHHIQICRFVSPLDKKEGIARVIGRVFLKN